MTRTENQAVQELVRRVAELEAAIAALTAEHEAEIEQLKALLYELTKDTVTDGGEGDICSYCDAVCNDDSEDENGNDIYGELDAPDNHKETCAWRRGVEMSLDVHRRKNAVLLQAVKKLEAT